MTTASRTTHRALLALPVLSIIPIGVASAAGPSATAASSSAWTFWLLLAAAALLGISNVLHLLKARTHGALIARLSDDVDALAAIVSGLTGQTTSARTPSPPPAPSVATGPGAGSAVLLALLLGAAGLQPACAAARKAPATAGHAVADCAKADALPIAVLVAAWALDAMVAGRINWRGIEAGSIAQGKVIGYCAAARFVEASSSSTATHPGVMPPHDPGAEMLERLRAHWGAV